jgi:hypothetical protein
LRAVEPYGGEFELGWKAPFPLCTDYLEEAKALIAKAYDIAKRVHGDNGLSPLPCDE